MKEKKGSKLTFIIVLAAVVAAVTTVVILLARANAKKRALCVCSDDMDDCDCCYDGEDVSFEEMRSPAEEDI